MTGRPYIDERDPAEPREWRETSSPGIRRHTLDITRAAVKAARDKHTRRETTEESTDE